MIRWGRAGVGSTWLTAVKRLIARRGDGVEVADESGLLRDGLVLTVCEAVGRHGSTVAVVLLQETHCASVRRVSDRPGLTQEGAGAAL